jgi:hypothetical protein
MINPELVTYIKNALAAGQSHEAITASLLTNGWSQSDVDEAFKSATPFSPTPTPSPTLPPASAAPQAFPGIQPAANVTVNSKKHSPLLLIVIVVVLAALGFVSWKFYELKKSTQEVADTSIPQFPIQEEQVAQKDSADEVVVETTTIDPRLFVPAKGIYTASTFIDIDKAVDGEKEIVLFYKGERIPDVGFEIYKFIGGNKLDKASWKQSYKTSTFSSDTPKILPLYVNGQGAAVITHTFDDAATNTHVVAWKVITEKLTAINDETLYRQLPFEAESYKRVDMGAVKVVGEGEFTQVFTPYIDDKPQSTITVHFLYKNNAVTVGKIER